MSKNRSVATEKPEGRFANGACELNHCIVEIISNSTASWSPI